MTDMDDLDQMFASAARQRAAPSVALVARIVQDADQAHSRPAPRGAVGQSWFAVLADWFGGGVSLVGMSAAAVMGVFLGVVQPTPVLALADLLTGQVTIDSLDVLPASSTFWAQE